MVQTRTRKFAFEIIWPLMDGNIISVKVVLNFECSNLNSNREWTKIVLTWCSLEWKRNVLMCLVCVTLNCIEGAYNVVKNLFEGAFWMRMLWAYKNPDATLEKGWPHFGTLGNVILSFELTVNWIESNLLCYITLVSNETKILSLFWFRSETKLKLFWS